MKKTVRITQQDGVNKNNTLYPETSPAKVTLLEEPVPPICQRLINVGQSLHQPSLIDNLTEAGLYDNVLFELRSVSISENLKLTGDDLLFRLFLLNTMKEIVIKEYECIEIIKITGGGPNRIIIKYDSKYGVEILPHETILAALTKQFEFTEDKKDILIAAKTIATLLERNGKVEPIPAVQVPVVITTLIQ